MIKGFKKYFPVWALFFIATVAIAFIIPVERDAMFYTLFCTALISHLIQLIISFFAFRNKNKEIVYPTFIYSIVGLVMLFTINAVVLYKAPFIKPWQLIIINIVVLVLHYVLLIALNTSLHKNVERDENIREQTSKMLGYVSTVKTIYDNTNNEDVYKLYETLKFSDKGSNGKTNELEEKIGYMIEELKELTDKEKIKELVENIKSLLNERKTK